MARMRVERLDHLGIVAGVCQERRFAPARGGRESSVSEVKWTARRRVPPPGADGLASAFVGVFGGRPEKPGGEAPTYAFGSKPIRLGARRWAMSLRLSSIARSPLTRSAEIEALAVGKK